MPRRRRRERPHEPTSRYRRSTASDYLQLFSRCTDWLLASLHIVEADRLIGLERAFEAEFLGHLAHRREHLLAHQPDAGLGVLVRDGAVIPPHAENTGP